MIAIVVGAGASSEFGLPTGSKLKSDIAKITDFTTERRRGLISGDQIALDAIEIVAIEVDGYPLKKQPYVRAAQQISENMSIAPSIDNFLDTHHQNEKLVTVGKLAIVKAILDSERGSSLYYDSTRNRPSDILKENSGTWIGSLFSILIAGRNFKDFLDRLSKIHFICFNYDRCIQQFFGYASKSYFNISENDTGEVMGALNIHYAYGCVDKIEWFDDYSSNYGNNISPENIAKLYKNIGIFTDGIDSDISLEIENTLNNSEVLIFMGFGFIDLNLKFLFNDNLFELRNLLATASGISEDSREIVKNKLKSNLRKVTSTNSCELPLSENQIFIKNLTCKQFFSEFDRRINQIISDI